MSVSTAAVWQQFRPMFLFCCTFAFPTVPMLLTQLISTPPHNQIKLSFYFALLIIIFLKLLEHYDLVIMIIKVWILADFWKDYNFKPSPAVRVSPYYLQYLVFFCKQVILLPVTITRTACHQRLQTGLYTCVWDSVDVFIFMLYTQNQNSYSNSVVFVFAQTCQRALLDGPSLYWPYEIT